MTYRLTAIDGHVQRIADGAIIPPDPDNMDRQAFQQWCDVGNTPEPYTPAAEELCVQINVLRDAKLAAGFSDVGETDKSYQCDPTSIANWTALTSAAGFALALGAAPLPTFALITYDNSTIELDAEEIYALMTERVMPWVSATYFYARTLKDQVLSETPPADINTGWP